MDTLLSPGRELGGAGRAGRGNNGVRREGIASRIELEAALHLLLLRKLAGAAILRLSGFLVTQAGQGRGSVGKGGLVRYM